MPHDAECQTPHRIPQPEPGLTAETVIERARALRPLLRQQQQESDWRGSYSPEVHQELLEGGLYRLLTPTMFGGYEMEPATFIRVVAEIARGHPAAGWCYALGASHAFLLASHFPEEVQRRMFGDNGEFRSPAVAGPAGKMTHVEGGYIVDGVFPFASGVPYATHFMGGSLAPSDSGRPRHVLFVLPRAEIEILPDWGEGRFMGMQASGSNSVRITERFVPEDQVVGVEMLMASEHAPEGTPGVKLHGNPMYTGVLLGWFNIEFAAILSGTALAALDEFEEAAHTKALTSDPSLKRKHDPFVQNLFGHCKGMAEAAWVLTLAAADLYLEQSRTAVRARRAVTSKDTFHVWGLAQQGARLACEVVERLFHASGASTGRTDQRLQRYFRDIEMYRLHIQSQATIPTARGKVELGLASGLFD